MQIPISAPHPDIVVLGYSEAAMFLRGKDGPRVGAVISIFGEQEFGVEVPDHIAKLELRFEDVESPPDDDPIAAYHARQRVREAAELGRRLGSGPTFEHAEAIVALARQIQAMQGILLCHCWGGVCRSPAAALICLATWRGPGREEECFRLVKATRWCASPHDGLVRFGDAILGRGGALARVLRGEVVERRRDDL